MGESQLPREVRRRLAMINHAEEVTGNVAMTCRYYGISRTAYYRWLRRYQEHGVDGLRDGSKRPQSLLGHITGGRRTGCPGCVGRFAGPRPGSGSGAPGRPTR
jgi:hypothetical protein